MSDGLLADKAIASRMLVPEPATGSIGQGLDDWTTLDEGVERKVGCRRFRVVLAWGRIWAVIRFV